MTYSQVDCNPMSLEVTFPIAFRKMWKKWEPFEEKCWSIPKEIFEFVFSSQELSKKIMLKCRKKCACARFFFTDEILIRAFCSSHLTMWNSVRKWESFGDVHCYQKHYLHNAEQNREVWNCISFLIRFYIYLNVISLPKEMIPASGRTKKSLFNAIENEREM